MTKDLGAGVSGYLEPEGRNWESIVYQASKPILDKELNLIQDAEQEQERRIRRRSFMPSGWLASDFLDTADNTAALFTASAVANELNIPQDLRAIVNGWLIRVANTNSNTLNLLDLGAAPTGAGVKRTDMVILEVWRRLLDAASVSTDGKSPAGRIWWHGNVKIDAADDLTLNFADDIEDGAVGAETTKRVQIQYRLRVVNGVDVQSYPYGIDDPTVFAHSVPAAPAAPDGVVTAFPYSNQSSNGDPGLWRAGDGSPANTLGTVDGYMYAIPLMAVFRRNDTAFARNTNHNGGVASPGPSDRPDGLFYDIIDAGDVHDLRLGVSGAGWNFQEIAERNFNYLLDNGIQTEVTTTLVGGGVLGNTVLTANEIGVTNANGGDGTTTGDTPGAEFIGQFDAVRRQFSDRCVIETLVLEYTPADGSGGGPNWANNDIITIDPSALPIYGYSAFNWASYIPANTTIIGLACSDEVGADSKGILYLGTGASQVRAEVQDDFSLTGVGAVPQGSLSLDIGTVPADVTDENLIVKLLVAYPKGQGLTDTPTADFGASSISVNNPGQLPAGSPVLFDQLEDIDFDYPHRELFLDYRTVDRVISFSGPSTDTPSQTADIIVFPERVYSITDIEINGGGSYGGSITLSTDGYRATLDPASLGNGDEATVTYRALRPLPQNDEQITVYFNARAPQTVRDGPLPDNLSVIPRWISPFLYTLTVGSGSQEEAFPFPYQYVQQPGVYPTSGGTFSGDHQLSGGGNIAFDSFTTSTGFVKLPAFVGYVPNPNQTEFIRTGGDVDAEGRTFYKEVPSSNYIPSSFAQPMKTIEKHRTLLPMLAELAADTAFGMKGQLVLLVFGKWYHDDALNVLGAKPAQNAIDFDTTLADNFTSVSVFRIKGNLLNRRFD